ncbi:MAG: hypothetical protein HAW67_05700 [Endozoicomonadaceae bacterium]|nr:hypothetical protein [Endozoicomonadaceae bacterium]MBE8233212.1 hypothetical protein [Endozoicomonadaceae bacterium]
MYNINSSSKLNPQPTEEGLSAESSSDNSPVFNQRAASGQSADSVKSKVDSSSTKTKDSAYQSPSLLTKTIIQIDTTDLDVYIDDDDEFYDAVSDEMSFVQANIYELNESHKVLKVKLDKLKEKDEVRLKQKQVLRNEAKASGRDIQHVVQVMNNQETKSTNEKIMLQKEEKALVDKKDFFIKMLSYSNQPQSQPVISDNQETAVKIKQHYQSATSFLTQEPKVPAKSTVTLTYANMDNLGDYFDFLKKQESSIDYVCRNLACTYEEKARNLQENIVILSSKSINTGEEILQLTESDLKEIEGENKTLTKDLDIIEGQFKKAWDIKDAWKVKIMMTTLHNKIKEESPDTLGANIRAKKQRLIILEQEKENLLRLQAANNSNLKKLILGENKGVWMQTPQKTTYEADRLLFTLNYVIGQYRQQAE